MTQSSSLAARDGAARSSAAAGATLRPPRPLADMAGSWPLLLGLAVLAVPTFATLADQTWSREAGAQGPIVLATGAWLLWRLGPELRRHAQPGALWLTLLILAVSLVSYILGRVLDYVTFEAGGLYGVGVAMFHHRFGPRLMRRTWFPLVYLAFAVPPPSVLIDRATAPLKHFVTWAATGGLHAVGLPVARQGVTIFVAQYQLLVADACSGMNSLIGLTAVSLLYIYLLRRASPLYALLLTAFIIPIAIAANIVRIVTLILLTYGFGDAVAQGFLHFTAGLFLFAIALLLVFAVDALLTALGARRRVAA
jgi:exosortase